MVPNGCGRGSKCTAAVVGVSDRGFVAARKDCAVVQCGLFVKVMEKASAPSHSSIGTGGDDDEPGREVLVGTRSVGASARTTTATSSTCTESDEILPALAAQTEPVAVPSMKGEMCVATMHIQRAAFGIFMAWPNMQVGAQLSA